jgi:hypothetical protein
MRAANEIHARVFDHPNVACDPCVGDCISPTGMILVSVGSMKIKAFPI